MKGRHKITVHNARVRYEVEIRRNITIIAGDSGTGKTTFYNMLRRAEDSSSAVKVVCDVPVYALSTKWAEAERYFADYDNAIFIFDENTPYLKEEYFARTVKGSSCYMVIITRKPLYMLPYSVKEVYKLVQRRVSEQELVFNSLDNLYEINALSNSVQPDIIIVEDSNSGFEFFSSIVKTDIEVVSAAGRDNIPNKVRNYSSKEKILVIVDGAACGAIFGRIITELSVVYRHSIVWCYESFEWLLLSSDLFKSKELKDILGKPYEYIESKDYFSWEQFFTALLCTVSKDTGLDYSKTVLNERYLEEGIKRKIFRNIPQRLDIL